MNLFFAPFYRPVCFILSTWDFPTSSHFNIALTVGKKSASVRAQQKCAARVHIDYKGGHLN